MEISADGNLSQGAPKILTSINAAENHLSWTPVKTLLIDGKIIPNRQDLTIYHIGPFSSPVSQLRIDGNRQQIAVYPDINSS